MNARYWTVWVVIGTAWCLNCCKDLDSGSIGFDRKSDSTESLEAIELENDSSQSLSDTDSLSDASGNADGVRDSDTNRDTDDAADTDADTDADMCLSADEPFVGTVTISSADDISKYSRYSVIQGNVSVGDVDNLVGLECLRHVWGAMWIVESNVLSLDGLDNLERVDGELEIGMDPTLQTAVLPSLQRVGWLSVYHNTILAELSLPALTVIDQGVKFDNNLHLPDCDALAIVDGLENGGDGVSISAKDNQEDECTASLP